MNAGLDDRGAQRQRLRAIIATTGLFGLFPLSLSPLMVAAGQAGGLSDLAAGSWVTSMLLGVAASAIGLGLISNRLRLGHILRLGTSAVVIIQLLLLVLSDLPLPLLCLLAFGSGLGSGCGIVVGDVLLARARNPMATAGIAMAITSTLMLGVFPLGMTMVADWGMATIAVLAIGSALMVLAMTAGLPFEQLRSGEIAASPVRGSFAPAAYFLLLCLFFFWARDGMVWSFAAIRAEGVGFAPDSIGLILGLAGACGIVGSAASAWIARGRSIAPDAVLAATVLPAMAACAWALADTRIAFGSLQLGYNALQLFAYPLLIGLAAQMDGSGRLAAVAGGMTLLGAAAGPIIGGAVSAFAGSIGLASAVAASSLASLLAIAIAVGWARLRLDQAMPNPD